MRPAAAAHVPSRCSRNSDGSVRCSVGLQSHAGRHGTDLRELVAFGRVAEASGLDGVVIGDHIVLGNRLDRYPYPPVHFTSDAPWAEPLTVLTAVGAVTSRITLTTGVIVSPLRPAVLLAKTAATIDAITGGRLELGVGVGWQPEEYEAVGADFAQRGRLLTDGIAACRTLWGPSPAEFHSPTVDFDELWCVPKPVRAGGIPVLFSGSLHERNLRRIVELGDGWITHPALPVDEIAAGVETLRAEFAAHDRDPASLRVRTRLPFAAGDDGPDFVATVRATRAYADAGVTDLTAFTTNFVDDSTHAHQRIEALGRAWAEHRPA
jgi:probable F420-dependent oxidoreductase